MKKAQGTQFNWIFILVSGSIILILFIVFAFDYKSLSEKRTNTELAIALDQKLNALKISKLTDVINPDGINRFNTKFFCDEISINNANTIDIKDKLIFAPEEIISEELLIWIDDFFLPYKISSMIYITSENIKYYLVYNQEDQQFINELLDYLPKKFNSDEQFFNIQAIRSIDKTRINSDIRKNNLREIKFILFNDANIPEFNIKTSAIKITPGNQGNIEFQDYNSYYVEKSLLIGAMFSDNYECVLDRTLKKLDNVNQIYKEKTINLWTKTQAIQPECNYQLLLGSFRTDFDVTSLYEDQKQLEQQNENLFKKGCQDIF